MKTIIKSVQVLSFLFLILSISTNTAQAQSTALKKWIGEWNIQSDFYEGTATIKIDPTGEFLHADMVLKSNKGSKDLKYTFLLSADIRYVKTREIIFNGRGNRASDNGKTSMKLQLYRYTTKDKAVGYYQMAAGNNTPRGIKYAFEMIKK